MATDPLSASSNGELTFDKRRKPFVNTLALIIIILTGVVLFVLIVMAWTNLAGAPFDNIKGLLTILLPLVGTWMGTILAFYFSKENFEAANQRVKELVNQITTTDEKLQVLKVSDIMLKPKDFALKIVDSVDAFQACKVLNLIEEMDSTHSERMPILQRDLKFIFLIYRTTLERFLIGYRKDAYKLNDNSKPDEKELTIKNMMESNYPLAKELTDMTNKGCFLPITASLAEVRQKMLDNSICQDVFITKTGNKAEPIEGWITNEIIIEKAELFKKAGARS